MTERSSNNSELIAAFLDVGRGDATVILSPLAGSGILVDCPAGAAPIVADFLESTGVSSLKLVVITHSDLDHAGGVIDVITGFSGTTECLAFFHDRVLETSPQTNSRYKVLLQSVAQLWRSGGVRPLSPFAGVKLPVDEVTISVLHPSEADLLEAFAQNNRNDASVVLMVEYQGQRLLLGADVQQKGWQWMKERGTDLKADVFKFPHHGAWYDGESSLDGMLSLVNPACVIISVGSTNGYGHPAIETLQLLQSHHTKLRFVCTQATSRCHGQPEAVASQARSLLPNENQGGQSYINSRSCPCAGSVMVRFSAAGWSLSPTIEQHRRVIELFSRPQCQVQQ